jgi:hypothetical protein
VCLSAGLCVGSGLGLVRLFVEIRGGQVCSRLLLKNYLFIFVYLLVFSCG